MFEDRVDAGRALAGALGHLAGREAVVLGIPRGGVEVAAEVARVHAWPLDVVVPRKLSAPQNPELGIGAIAPGVRVLDERMVRDLAIPETYVAAEVARQDQEIARRTSVYRGGRPPPDLDERIAILVDDGVATGGTAIAAVRWAKLEGASLVVLAVPVAPAASLPALRAEADELVCLATPEPFHAVGQWYRRFDQLDDARVIELLEPA